MRPSYFSGGRPLARRLTCFRGCAARLTHFRFRSAPSRFLMPTSRGFQATRAQPDTRARGHQALGVGPLASVPQRDCPLNPPASARARSPRAGVRRHANGARSNGANAFLVSPASARAAWSAAEHHPEARPEDQDPPPRRHAHRGQSRPRGASSGRISPQAMTQKTMPATIGRSPCTGAGNSSSAR